MFIIVLFACVVTLVWLFGLLFVYLMVVDLGVFLVVLFAGDVDLMVWVFNCGLVCV